jgi:hypothetical protein
MLLQSGLELPMIRAFKWRAVWGSFLRGTM